MTRMPRLPRWANRSLPAASVALAACAAWSAPALAGVSLTVQPTRGEPVTVSTDGLDPEIIDAVYTVRERDGTVEDVRVTGFSIRQLLERANLDTGYGTVEMTRPDGRMLAFSRKQINSSEPPPPVIYTDEAGVTRFLRPQWGNEVNAVDDFEVSGTLALTLNERSPIKVTVSASPEEIEAGESVTFEASASGGRTDDYVFHWDFRDGTSKKGPAREVPHKFKKRGEYRVQVTASLPGEHSDAVETEVTVGEPEESDRDRSGGGTDTTGGADGGPTDGSGGGGTTSGATSPPTPSYAPPAYTPPTPAPYKPAAPTPPSSTPAPGVATDGSFVEGNLLADAGDPPSGGILESAARAARDGTPRDSDEGGGVPEAALALAGALALLGLGAALELRQGPTLRPRRG
jgi:PKD domain